MIYKESGKMPPPKTVAFFCLLIFCKSYVVDSKTDALAKTAIAIRSDRNRIYGRQFSHIDIWNIRMYALTYMSTMRKITTILLCATLLFVASQTAEAKNRPAATTNQLYFIENKGQVTDQFHNARRDIQFALHGQGITVFIGQGQLHYQFAKMNRNNKQSNVAGKAGKPKDMCALEQRALENGEERQVESYRMDVTLTGADANAVVIAEDEQVYYERYYLPGCPQEGIEAHTFNKITYKNIYPGIDWVLYIKGDKLEHEFVVKEGGNAADIKLKYDGQTSLKINNDGSITAITPMGVICEQAPVCYTAEGKIAPSSFRLKNDVLSYELNTRGAVIIDPVLLWGTYYGPDSTTLEFYDIACDRTGHIYGGGLSWAATDVATTGSFQATYGGGCDAFLVKFDTSGARLWATYYGGTSGDWGVGVACDTDGMIYLEGTTGSPGMSTPGTQQVLPGGGGWDGFIAKFTPSGARVWCTYNGGSGTNYNGSIACDKLGHVYVAGVTNDNNNTGTPGSYHPTKAGGYDDYLIQYNTSNGVRNWGTYYGGPQDEFQGGVCSDGLYVYITGYTSSTTTMSTPGSFQTTFGGLADAFLAKFDQYGSRIWGTYYGGSAAESVGGITCNKGGYIYLLGSTSSDDVIASPGCFQPARAGMVDAFLVKIEPELGQRIWGTYYGGPLAENTDLSRIICDDSDNIYITGFTESTTGVSTPDSWQPTFGGGTNDAFFAKFTNEGFERWSTYYGGSGVDEGQGTAFDGKSVYICGRTTSPNNIATPDGFLPVGGGHEFYYLGFLAKFGINDTPLVTLLTGLPQSTKESVSIYPVPNRGTFILTGSFESYHGLATVTVSDMIGKVALNDVAVVRDGKINMQVKLEGNLPSGDYIIKVVSPQGKVNVLKFVKE
jgi:hypothetical protein